MTQVGIPRLKPWEDVKNRRFGATPDTISPHGVDQSADVDREIDRCRESSSTV